MISDSLRNAHLYRGLSPRIALAFDFLRGTDLQPVATGTVEIDGKQVYAIFQEYETLSPEHGAWEAHGVGAGARHPNKKWNRSFAGADESERGWNL